MNETKQEGAKRRRHDFKFKKEATRAWKTSGKTKRDRVVVFSSNYTLYHDFSQRVKATLGIFAQSLENYSIDESFLEFLFGADWGELGVANQTHGAASHGHPRLRGFWDDQGAYQARQSHRKKAAGA